jgi:hypothetical protein
MELQLRIIGIILIGLALIHFVFPKYFGWKKELSWLSLINRQMMYVHTFFVAATVFLMGLLCLTSAAEITTTALGRKVAFGLSLFWTARLFIQFFGYSSKLWKGKPFETTVHVVFVILWAYLSAVFITISWTSRGTGS